MAEACSERPVVITANLFVCKAYTMADGTNGKFDITQARAVYNALIRKEYVDDDGALTARYFDDKRNGTLCFDKADDMKDGIIAALDTVFNPSAVKPEDARKPKQAKFQKDNFAKKEFQELWKRINRPLLLSGELQHNRPREAGSKGCGRPAEGDGDTYSRGRGHDGRDTRPGSA